MSFMNFCLSRKYALLNRDQLDFFVVWANVYPFLAIIASKKTDYTFFSFMFKIKQYLHCFPG